VHAGAQPDPTTGARATPIYQPRHIVFNDADHAASLVRDCKAFGNIIHGSGIRHRRCWKSVSPRLRAGTAALAVASRTCGPGRRVAAIAEAGDEFIARENSMAAHQPVHTMAFKSFGWNVVVGRSR